MSATDSLSGLATPGNAADPFSAMTFVIRQYMAGVRTAMLVQVKAVSNDGGVSPVGSVDVQPLVHRMASDGEVSPHGVVYGMPYLRIQGGSNAVIMDPKVGDLGLAIVADRDISVVTSTKSAGAPGSSRRNSFSDGLYLGGFLNGTPTQYVQFTDSGITVKSPTLVTIDAPKTKVAHDLEVSGNLQVDGATAVQGITAHGVSIDEMHTHTSESPGTPTSSVIP